MTNKETVLEKFKIHKQNVQKKINNCVNFLNGRAGAHDLSKEQEPELSMFIKSSQVLDNVKYGSDEYNKSIDDMKKEALGHHYLVNRHHPEHYKDGISGMSIIDIMEMMCDWAAASEQYGTDIQESVETSIKRFHIAGTPMENIIRNSVPYFYNYGIRIIYPDGTSKNLCSNDYDELLGMVKSLPMTISSSLIKLITDPMSSDGMLDLLILPIEEDEKSSFTEIHFIKNQNN